MDNKVKAALVDEMTRTKGWEVVLAWIGAEIKRCNDKLEVTDPTDAVAVSKLQERIRSYRYLLRTVENITNEV